MDSKYFLLLIGLPHNSHSDGVSGNFSFNIVVRGSQNGTKSSIEKNLQLLKCKMKAASHGGPSGRDNSIKELAEEFSFILKTAGIKN